MTLYKSLSNYKEAAFRPIRDGDDWTTQFICVVAGVALIGGAILILAMLINIWFPARFHRAEIIVHDQQTFAKLQAKHGKVNTGVVVYEEDGQAYYYKGEEKIKFQ